MPCEGAEFVRWRLWLCQALSAASHAALFLTGGFLVTVAAEFGVDAGAGGRTVNDPQEMQAEVELVEYETAPKVLAVVEEPVVAEEQTVAEEPTTQEEAREVENLTMPEPTPTATPEPIVTQEPDRWTQPAPVPTPVAKPPKQRTAGSAAPGSSKNRERPVASRAMPAASGAQSARADYLRNPPPVYPAEAKRNRQQGVAFFRVVVSAAGQAESVTLIKSSGHRMLDNSALEAVRKWKFHPGTIGGVKVSSTVKVPVRFRLD
jgi:periplasmic protein TonB